MPAKAPTGPPPPPVVQRIRVQYAKRGRLRFTSHRDVARMLERALRRAQVPMAFSAGFSPHPKLSYVGAAPTGVASEAEYLELGLAEERDPEQLRVALDGALPPGIDIVATEQVRAGDRPLPERIDASSWLFRLPGVAADELAAAMLAFLAEDTVLVARRTGDGTRQVDARAAVVSARVVASDWPGAPAGIVPAGDAPSSRPAFASPCATLHVVVRHTTPAVRPDDVLAGVRHVTGLAPAAPLEATRLAQGLLDGAGEVADPFERA
jgi:radical SAM-linked protein